MLIAEATMTGVLTAVSAWAGAARPRMAAVSPLATTAANSKFFIVVSSLFCLLLCSSRGGAKSRCERRGVPASIGWSASPFLRRRPRCEIPSGAGVVHPPSVSPVSGSQGDDWPVVVDMSEHVEVVGEGVEGEVGHELADLLVGHPGVTGGLDVVVIDVAGVCGDVIGQFQ